MKKYENECRGCATPSYPCIGSSCKNTRVPRWYCDKCGDEFEPEALYVVDNCEELCADCILLGYETVAQLEGREINNE